MKTVGIEQLDEMAAINTVLQVLVAWRAFKRTHDVASAEVSCCNHTRKLFTTLDELEKDITELPPR